MTANIPSRAAGAMTLADFERLLEVYGADRTRWPLAARAAAVTRLASDAAARRLLAEAEALDAVLLRAPEPTSVDVEALSNRILAATAKAPRLVASAEGPSPLPRAARNGGSMAARGSLPAAVVLAASLVVGVFVGQSRWGEGAVPAFEQLTGLTLPATDQMALAEIHVDPIDED